jgi:hypothetical protein
MYNSFSLKLQNFFSASFFALLRRLKETELERACQVQSSTTKFKTSRDSNAEEEYPGAPLQ